MRFVFLISKRYDFFRRDQLSDLTNKLYSLQLEYVKQEESDFKYITHFFKPTALHFTSQEANLI